MKKIDIVFIVLTFRNHEDLKQLLKSIDSKVHVPYKVVVVNSYYDEESKLIIENISKENNCDFINVTNNGYGAGNNAGIKYVNENYVYKFISICNPDTEIVEFNYKKIRNFDNEIIAPHIVTLNDIKQNPFRVIDIKLLDKLKYQAFKKRKYKTIYIDIIINKLAKILVEIYHLLIKRSSIYPIYSCHGSFLLISRKAIDKLGEIYNERMFLFSEEDHLAKLAKRNKVRTVMIPSIKILHKEDGSINLSSVKKWDSIRQSYIEYYKHWYK